MFLPDLYLYLYISIYLYVCGRGGISSSIPGKALQYPVPGGMLYPGWVVYPVIQCNLKNDTTLLHVGRHSVPDVYS